MADVVAVADQDLTQRVEVAMVLEVSQVDSAESWESNLYDRSRLQPGNSVAGPAVIFQADSTTVLPVGWTALVDGWRNLVAERLDNEG